MEGFCRSCLVKFDEPTDLVSYSEKNRRLFVYATGLQVKRNDTFTFQLCKECYLNMKVACNFKKTCRNSDKKYKHYLSSKEAGDNVDFCTFLKNNDESLKFRFPLYPGNSTPANRNKDDDNESTCTSIQNFMTDILQADEIPDSEARIIKEVIEEEADILEDSLDSHWLQDDVSIDTDFRMDFSFSPFSTPRSTIGDKCYTPKTLNDLVTGKEECIDTMKLEHDKENHEITNFNTNIAIPGKDEMIKNEKIGEEIKDIEKCTIDINLENALKKDSAKKIMLDEILATPPVIPNMSGSTPLIKSILFGDKMDINIETGHKNVYAPTDIIKEEEMDVLYEFLQTNNEDDKVTEEYREEYSYAMENDNNENVNIVSNKAIENKSEVKETVKEPSSPVENKYCLKRFYCKICDRQFKNVVALKVHCNKIHKIKIESAKKKRVYKQMICDYCGKMFTSAKCIVTHIQNHMKPYHYYCEHCPLSFRTETGLKAHKVTHGVFIQTTKTKRLKKYVCNICGSALTSSSNYHTHMRRHSNTYTKSCGVCGKGFYRTSDLDAHMRCHTGERPFECFYCPSAFARQDVLNRHIKRHTGEKPFTCIICDARFINARELKIHQSNCKACLEKQMEAVAEASNLNDDDVIVHYAKVSNNELLTEI